MRNFTGEISATGREYVAFQHVAKSSPARGRRQPSRRQPVAPPRLHATASKAFIFRQKLLAVGQHPAALERHKITVVGNSSMAVFWHHLGPSIISLPDNLFPIKKTIKITPADERAAFNEHCWPTGSASFPSAPVFYTPSWQDAEGRKRGSKHHRRSSRLPGGGVSSSFASGPRGRSSFESVAQLETISMRHERSTVTAAFPAR